MKELKRLFTLIAALLALCALPGCSGLSFYADYLRLEDIELIRTVAVDKDGDGVDAVICGTAGEKSAARLYERSGASLAEALTDLRLMSLGRTAILSHTETMLIGEDLAREGVGQCLDYIERYAEMRLDTGVLIVRESTAKELVVGLSGADTPASDVIRGLTENVARTGRGYPFTCREIISSMAESGCALVLCVRGVEEEKLFDARGDLNLRPDGFAVVCGDKVHDFLSEEETLGTMLLLSKLQAMDADLAVENTTVTVCVDGIETDIAPRFSKDGALEGVTVKLKAQANVINLDGVADITTNEYRRQAEEALSSILASAIRSVLEKSQGMEMDFLDLRGILTRKEPLKMADLAEPWEALFPTLPVEIEAESILRRTYDITDPPQVAEEEEEETPWEKLIRSLRGN